MMRRLPPRAVVIPAIASAGTAGLSLLFYLIVARVFGENWLGELLIIQAGTAIVGCALMPQALLHLLGAKDREERVERYREAASIEWICYPAGLLAITVVAMHLDFVPAEWRSAIPIIFASLGIQGFGSIMGWLRAEQDWPRYLAWNLLPNVVRVPMMVLLLTMGGTESAQFGNLTNAEVVALIFLLPDLCRVAAIALPIWLKYGAFVSFGRMRSAFRSIRHNWLYDLGSSLTETGDRIVVGLLLSPTLLVFYFFARRLGVVATMVTEPIFAEAFRRGIEAGKFESLKTVARSFAAALVVAGAMIGIAFASLLWPETAEFIPPVVSTYPAVLLAIVGIDALIASSRWNRYVAHVRQRGTELLYVRLLAFICFVAVIYFTNAGVHPAMLVIALATAWSLETSYLVYAARRVDPGPSPRSAYDSLQIAATSRAK